MKCSEVRYSEAELENDGDEYLFTEDQMSPAAQRAASPRRSSSCSSCRRISRLKPDASSSYPATIRSTSARTSREAAASLRATKPLRTPPLDMSEDRDQFASRPSAARRCLLAQLRTEDPSGGKRRPESKVPSLPLLRWWLNIYMLRQSQKSTNTS